MTIVEFDFKRSHKRLLAYLSKPNCLIASKDTDYKDENQYIQEIYRKASNTE